MVLKHEFWKEKKVHFCKLGYGIPFKATYGKIKNIIRVKFSFKSEYVDL